MNRKIAVVTSVGVALGMLGGCGGGSSSDSLPPVASGGSGSSAPTGGSTSPTPQSLDTQMVLALAQKTSETATPFMVSDGYVVLNDTSDTATPLSINTM
jgi:hypothetical protein